MRPTTRSATARPNPVAPYRKAISERLEAAERVDGVEHDPDADEVEAGRSTKPLTAIIQNDAGYAIEARVHIRAMSR